MGRFGQAPIGSLPTRSNRIWVSAARPRPTDQRKDTRSLIRRSQTCSDSNTIMLTVLRIADGAHGGCPSRIRCQAATGSWTKSRQWETQRTLFSSARATVWPPAKVDGVWPFNDAWLRTSL